MAAVGTYTAFALEHTNQSAATMGDSAQSTGGGEPAAPVIFPLCIPPFPVGELHTCTRMPSDLWAAQPCGAVGQDARPAHCSRTCSRFADCARRMQYSSTRGLPLVQVLVLGRNEFAERSACG